ncbi:DUF2029 domain-containing protein [Desertihabitans brevis]|uniref:DUF2029 domain-containing protein n=1 Tax=Desertihabitans brevis TaxID=2268447 RepID=A0A367YYQ5_9ACTN|nr:glycosyltransferase family 87 protein [Desertihabitans brevis]RCK71026.1 DUF2029 domain-containing protein [Desertihabitans brevis]
MTTAEPTRRGDVTIPTGGVWLSWLLTRLLVLAVWGLFERIATGDVLYYHGKLAALGEAGVAGTLVEYPTPVVALMAVPWLAGAGTQAGFLVAFVAAMLALDAWLTRRLHRSGAPATALLFWLAFVPLLGPLALLRFDMVPAVLAGVALLWSTRRPATAGGLVAAGAAIKLWPALLVPALLGGDRRWRTLAGFAGTGVALALVSLVAGGWDRLVSPLTWQSDRGLQVESVWATVLMVLHGTSPETYTVGYSRYQAFEVFGPQVGAWTTAANLSMVAGLAVMAVLFWRVWRSGRADRLAAATVMAAVVALMIVTNKTLSPQYVLWLGGPVAVMLAEASGTGSRHRRPVLWFAGATLVLTALTHLVYPVMYGALVYDGPGPAQALALVVLALRNVGLLGLTVAAVVLAWRLTGRVTETEPERSVTA